MFSVSRLNEFFELEKITGLKNSIDHRLKPLGALGKIEDIALQMALIQNLTPKDSIKTRARHLIFAGDHGIAQNHSVSIEKSGFTTNLINSCLSQDAGINAFLKTQNIPLTVINSGVLNPNFIAPVKNCSLGKITKDFSIEDAMTETELNLAEKYSKDLISECLKEGITTLLFGEIGIGNTTSSAAIMSKALDISPEISTGPGTGIDKEHFNLKKALIKKALERHHEHLNARDILKAYGGYEIAEMTFTMLEAAKNNLIIVVDGITVSIAALLATKLYPKALGYMIFATESGEPGHHILLEHLGVEPILRLGLRLGEGTGAALAYPILVNAASFFNNMAEWREDGTIVKHHD